LISNIEDYFNFGCGRCARFATPDCSVRHWSTGLASLRQICLDMELVETVKWGHPCYMYADRNIAIFGAFRNDFRISFMNASLLKNPSPALEPIGPNSLTPSIIRFAQNDKVFEQVAVIRAVVAELKGYAKAGIKPTSVERHFDMPDELIEALDTDPELAEAFAALTPGRQKSYMFNLSQAKKPETRIARIEKFRNKIIAGKGALER